MRDQDRSVVLHTAMRTGLIAYRGLDHSDAATSLPRMYNPCKLETAMMPSPKAV